MRAAASCKRIAYRCIYLGVCAYSILTKPTRGGIDNIYVTKKAIHMTYATYHDLQADLFAQRYYALDYAELTLFMQLMVDEQLADAYLDYRLERAEL